MRSCAGGTACWGAAGEGRRVMPGLTSLQALENKALARAKGKALPFESAFRNGAGYRI